MKPFAFFFFWLTFSFARTTFPFSFVVLRLIFLVIARDATTPSGFLNILPFYTLLAPTPPTMLCASSWAKKLEKAFDI